MPLDDVVNVSIDRQSTTLSLPGFGTPMILPDNGEIPAAWVASGERLRYYTSAQALLDDGFSATSETYLEALALMSQEIRPRRFAVGRRLAEVAHVVTITITAVANNTNYIISAIFDGDESYGPFDYLSDGSALDTEIRDGLIALINATAVLVTASVGASNTIILTADTAGIPMVVTETDTRLTQADTTPNVGIPQDLAAITTEQPDWYGLLITQHTSQFILTAALEIESQRRMFFAQSTEAGIVGTPYNAGSALTDDIASKLKVRGLARTALFYHPTATQRLAAAAVGRCLPPVAGSISWKFKQLAGVASFLFSATARTNLLSKNANGYEPFAGEAILFEGQVAEGEFIDIIHGIDRLHSRIQELVATTLLNLPKVPFTQAGINALAGDVRTALEEASNPNVALIAESRVRNNKTEVPAYTVTPPSVEDIPSGDRAARRIPATNPIVFEGTLAGAIHSVEITGTLAV